MGLDTTSNLRHVQLEESYSKRLREVYKLQECPRTLDDLSKIWNQRLLASVQTERGKQSFDRMVRGELAYGETKTNTRHLVRLRTGRATNVYCALDALIESFFQDVDVESSCPHCKEEIKLKMLNRKIVTASPQSTALWLGVSPTGEGQTTEVLCPFINFFSSQNHAEQWRSDNPDQLGVLLTLSQAQDFITNALPHAQKGLE